MGLVVRYHVCGLGLCGKGVLQHFNAQRYVKTDCGIYIYSAVCCVPVHRGISFCAGKFFARWLGVIDNRLDVLYWAQGKIAVTAKYKSNSLCI